MALPEATVGLLPCAGGTQNLAILVGEGWTKRMILCGERVKANKALEIGLVEEVVASGEGLNAALAAKDKGFSAIVLEKEKIANTIENFPEGKWVYAPV